MKKTLFSLLVVGALIFGAGWAAEAESTDPTLVKVPFSFLVGDKVLPAGTYRITTFGMDGSSLLIASADGKHVAAFAAAERIPSPEPEGAYVTHVSFKNYAGQRFLWRVVTPGSEARQVILRERDMDRTLARLNLLPPERADVASK